MATPFSSPVHLRHGCDRRNLHRTHIHTGKRLGTGSPEMFTVTLCDLLRFGLVSGGNQIAVIGEDRAEEGVSIHVVGAYLQAQPALEAFSRLILVLMFLFSLFCTHLLRRLVFPNIHIGLSQIFMDDRPVYDQVVDHRKFLQGTDRDLVSFRSLTIVSQAKAGIPLITMAQAPQVPCRQEHSQPIRVVFFPVSSIISSW